MPVYEEVLEQAHHNVRQLGEQLSALESLKLSLADAREIPDQWDEKFREIAATTKEYTDAINAVANTYVEGNNQVIGNNLDSLRKSNVTLQEQVKALVAYDFAADFKSVQHEVAEEIKGDLRTEITKVQTATADLDGTNEAFRKEISRWEAVDLEAHFNRHQKVLSDVFQAVNGINSLLGTNTQTLIGIQGSIVAYEQHIDKQKEALLNAIQQHDGKLEKFRVYIYAIVILAVVGCLLAAYVAFR